MALLTKGTIKELLAQSRTEEALTALRSYPKIMDLPAIENELILQSAKWSDYEIGQLRGSVSPQELSQLLRQVQAALLTITDDLPDETVVQVALQEQDQVKGRKPKAVQGILEDKFKNQVFMLMIGTKLIVFGWIYFHVTTGGFSVGQAKATATLLLPIFVAYLSAMFNDMLGNRYIPEKMEIKKQRYIRNSLRYVTYALFPIYTYLLIHIIGLKAQGALGDEAPIEEMNSWLALVETGLGVYIGQVVFTLFEKGK